MTRGVAAKQGAVRDMVTLAAATTATTSAAEACTSITSSARDTRLNTQPAAAPQLGGIGGHTRTPRCIQPICTAAPRLEQPLQQQPGARPHERRRWSAREAKLQSHARTHMYRHHPQAQRTARASGAGGTAAVAAAAAAADAATECQTRASEQYSRSCAKCLPPLHRT